MEIFRYLLRGIGMIYLGIIGGIAVNYLVIKNSDLTPIKIINKEENIYIEENTALADAIRDVKDCVIGVKTGSVYGSGLMLTSDGLAVTLAENMPQGIESNILYQAAANSAYQVLKRDLVGNLALVKLDNKNTKTIGFFDLSNLNIGLRVFVISQIYNDQKGRFFSSVDEGIVKSFDADIIKTNIISLDNINGSPVFDIERRVIGLALKDADNFINIIPVSEIRSFVGL